MQIGGGASGGMDDCFDFQLVSASVLDGEGLSYIGPTAPGTGAGGLSAVQVPLTAWLTIERTVLHPPARTRPYIDASAQF